MMEIKTDNSKVIDQLQKQNAEQAARIERLEKAVLIAIHALPGGESKSDVRDIYDETPAQSLAARDAEVVHAFLNKHGTRTGDIIEIDIIDLPHGKYGKQQTNGE
jgi:hypothetical protein|tara:strand:- start:4942 stop:5256 length:315 start_codon:yes stop_codon:yes gene_type:complete